MDDAQQTVNFLFQHKPHIHSAAMGTFLMERDSPAHRFPQSFNVQRVIEEPEKDLAIYFDYEAASGIQPQMAELIHDRFLETLPDKPYPHFYMSDVYRFLYASHNAERGVTESAVAGAGRRCLREGQHQLIIDDARKDSDHYACSANSIAC